jgi:hypothetical protein
MGRTSIVPVLAPGCPAPDLDGLLQAAALDDVEPADRLLRLGERTVGDDCLPVADTDGACVARRSQLVAADPDAPRLEVVQPAEKLFVSGVGRVGLGLGVHPFASQQISMRNLAPRSKLSSPRQPPVVGTP